MLSHAFKLDAEAAAVERAIVRTLEQGFRTKEIHTPGMTLVGTKEMGAAILKNLQD
jgi:3-isopropylmalate dehydrogenase